MTKPISGKFKQFSNKNNNILTKHQHLLRFYNIFTPNPHPAVSQAFENAAAFSRKLCSKRSCRLRRADCGRTVTKRRRRRMRSEHERQGGERKGIFGLPSYKTDAKPVHLELFVGGGWFRFLVSSCFLL